MPSWRCPHCSTPQPEASRCWVCHRSSTSCATCRHFRTSVAARVGFCGLDRRRLPLIGDEVRPCWEDGAVPAAPDPQTPGLLDLLTDDAQLPVAPARPSSRPASLAALDAPLADAPIPFDGAPNRREWVEVEA